MKESLRFDLVGSRAEAWDKLFDRLLHSIERAIDELAADTSPDTRPTCKDASRDLSEIARGLVHANLDHPALKNEKLVADIALRFEEAKLARAQREMLEVETNLKRVLLEKARRELCVRHLADALKLMGILRTGLVRTNDGAALVVTRADLKALTDEVDSEDTEADQDGAIGEASA